jgi:sarcosine oxidase, subunit beta
MSGPGAVESLQAEVVVIGAGLTGLQVAWNLTQLGVKQVVVLERNYPGCELYGRFSAGVRRQFGSQLEIELTLASLPFFERLLREPAIKAGYEPVGYAFLAGREDRAGLRRTWLLQQDMGIGSEWLEGPEIKARFPYCECEGVAAATFCADDFWLNPWEVHRWLLRACREAGVEIRERCPLTALEISRGAIQSASGPNLKVKTPVVVNAAGAYARLVQRLAGSDAPVDPSPRVKYLTPAPPELPRTMPLITDLPTGTYVRNEGGQVIVGVKPPLKVVGFQYATSSAALDWMQRQAAIRYPALARGGTVVPTRLITGLYDITPDGLPLAGPDAGVKGLYLAAGFNGHGVMHSPAVGCSVAELIVLGKAATFDLSRLGPARFINGNIIPDSGLHLL